VKALRRISALLLAGLALAGCGGAERSDGTATLWVTRDRGATVLLDTRVPAGQTLLRALRSKTDVGTRYGGRFIQSIDGLNGSLARQHDWFWFVNGYAGGSSAAEYRLHDGDVAWWDYRGWAGDAETILVVAGAFPEPFVHGFGGERRPAAVRYAPGSKGEAQRVADRVGAVDVAPIGDPVPAADNLVELTGGAAPTKVQARLRASGGGPGAPVRFVVSGPVDDLLAGRLRREFGS
jgi:hypothetical protein